MVGHVAAPDWLATDWMLRQFGRARVQAQERYAQFVTAGATQPRIWQGLQHQLSLWDAQFVERM